MAEKTGRRKLVANLPPALRTRAQNKNQHPGAPDLPKPRCSATEMAAETTARQEKLEAQKAAVNRVAEIENQLQAEDDGLSNPEPSLKAASEKPENDSDIEEGRTLSFTSIDLNFS